MKKKYNTCIIGTGRIGFLLENDPRREQPASHSAAFCQNKRIRLIAACDINQQNLNKWKEKYTKASVYQEIDTLFKNNTIDIAVIAVNEESHLQVFKKVAAYQPKLILLEKPVAPNPKDAQKIREIAAQFNLNVLINHERRYSLDYIQAKKLIRTGKIGEVQSVHGFLWSGMAVYKDESEKEGNCSLIHDGTHLVDIINYLFDIALNHPHIDFMLCNEDRDVDHLNLHYLNGNTIFHLEFSGSKKFFGFELDIVGTTGRIIIGNGYFKVYERKPSPFYTNFYSLVKNERINRPKLTGYFSGMVKNCVNFLD